MGRHHRTGRGWVVAVLLLGAGGVQAALTPYTVNGVDLVYDDDFTPVGASTPGLTWTADANLFQTQYDADNTVVNQIIAAVPSIIHSGTPSPYPITVADFDTTTGGMSWFGAMAWAEWLGSINYGGANDWRLWSPGSDPICQGFNCTASELGHLYYTEGHLTAGSPITDSTALTEVFDHLQNDTYWSGEEFMSWDMLHAWVLFDVGSQGPAGKNNLRLNYAWAVRPGQIANNTQPIPTLSVWGLGLLGLLLAGLARARMG